MLQCLCEVLSRSFGQSGQVSSGYTWTVLMLCVNNVGAVFPNSKGRTEFKRQTVKYTAQKLYEKKVIRDIEGLPQHQYVLIKVNIVLFLLLYSCLSYKGLTVLLLVTLCSVQACN